MLPETKLVNDTNVPLKRGREALVRSSHVFQTSFSNSKIFPTQWTIPKTPRNFNLARDLEKLAKEHRPVYLRLLSVEKQKRTYLELPDLLKILKCPYCKKVGHFRTNGLLTKKPIHDRVVERRTVCRKFAQPSTGCSLTISSVKLLSIIKAQYKEIAEYLTQSVDLPENLLRVYNRKQTAAKPATGTIRSTRRRSSLRHRHADVVDDDYSSGSKENENQSDADMENVEEDEERDAAPEKMDVQKPKQIRDISNEELDELLKLDTGGEDRHEGERAREEQPERFKGATVPLDFDLDEEGR